MRVFPFIFLVFLTSKSIAMPSEVFRGASFIVLFSAGSWVALRPTANLVTSSDSNSRASWLEGRSRCDGFAASWIPQQTP